MSKEILSCTLCPRECGANRQTAAGFCGAKSEIRLARAALHFWEEPCISGKNGSGTVFFSGCPLKCCFCQNHKISARNFGREISPERLAEIFLELQAQNAHNINLVSPTQYVPQLLRALDRVKHRLFIPVVYNTGGYERVETLRLLEGYVDIYLPDVKYKDSALSARYSGASDYFERASQAALEMFRQTGAVDFDEGGMLRRGVILRHMMLPTHRRDSMEILRWIAESFPKDAVRISLMSQYTPFHKSGEHPEINRRVSTFEYNAAVDCALRLGLCGYMQEKSSAKEEYTPDFSLQGVER